MTSYHYWQLLDLCEIMAGFRQVGIPNALKGRMRCQNPSTG